MPSVQLLGVSFIFLLPILQKSTIQFKIHIRYKGHRWGTNIIPAIQFDTSTTHALQWIVNSYGSVLSLLHVVFKNYLFFYFKSCFLFWYLSFYVFILSWPFCFFETYCRCFQGLTSTRDATHGNLLTKYNLII